MKICGISTMFTISRPFMASLECLCIAVTVLIIRATPCGNGQHCSDCYNNGDCSAPCESGYYGKKCMAVCNRRCQNQSCELTDTGIEYCTEGCVPGFRGTSCKIPCHSTGTQCTECEGGCDGGYCRLSSTSCVSGCVDSYYGLDCKDCSERCKSCNRSTGMCDSCRDPYTGLNCEMSCENCAGSCVAGCDGGCKPGFYGDWCDKMCSENCRPGINTTAGSDLECDQNTSVSCIPECDNNTGDCIHGCIDGWYGKHCSTRCNRKCAGMACTESGSCADGCASGYAGTDCSCFENCIHEVCHPSNGSCVKGCINGYYGANCNISCNVCLDGVCDRTHGTCIRGCTNTDRACPSNCTKDCPLEACLKDRKCPEDGQPKLDIKYITIGLSAVMFLTGTLCTFCLVKYWSKRRSNEADTSIVEYQPPSNRYYEIMDVDVEQESDSSETESNDVTPPLAEQLQAVHGSGRHTGASSSDGTSEDNPLYTHLERENCIGDQTSYVKYITPAEETDVR